MSQNNFLQIALKQNSFVENDNLKHGNDIFLKRTNCTSLQNVSESYQNNLSSESSTQAKLIKLATFNTLCV